MASPSSSADRPLRVVLVDDHTVLRQGLRRSLEQRGIEVVAEAGDGEIGVRRALETHPDVVLMDVSMPRLDGVGATRRLLAADGRQHVLMLTAHDDAHTVGRAVDAGATGYLTKDATTKDLLEAIDAVAHAERAFAASVERFASAWEQSQSEGTTPMLGAREIELLQLVVDGLSSPEVAERMCISQKTVKNHLASIYDKLGAHDRTQAVVAALRLGLVQLH